MRDVENYNNFIIETIGLTKKFGDFTAVDSVNLRVRRGDIMCIIGENGAGKTTLMNMLYGLLQPTEGEILIDGKSVKMHSPKDAIKNRIGMVHQHFKLAPSLTVYENIFLGTEINRTFHNLKLPLVDNREERKRAEKLIEQYNFDLDPNAKVKDISIGLQQRVEILKMLLRDVDTLILDEPTAVLTPQEVDELIGILKRLRDGGKTIIIITHKLREVKSLSDHCAILRRGKLVGTFDISDKSEDELAAMMVGRKVKLNVEKEEHDLTAEPVVYEVKNLCVKGRTGQEILHDISFAIRRGEILGVAGVEGNGQYELTMALTGMMEANSGQVLLENNDVTNFWPKNLRNNGVAIVPEDRFQFGLCRGTNVAKNLVAGYHSRPDICRFGVLNYRAMRKKSEKLIQDFDIRTSGSDVDGWLTDVGGLSGGNAQKVVVAREFSANAKALIVSRPTRGVDVGSIEFIYQKLIELREQGKAILLISSELSEILGLADNVVVMYRGRITGHFRANETTQEELGLYMMGVKSEQEDEGGTAV